MDNKFVPADEFPSDANEISGFDSSKALKTNDGNLFSATG